mgnify:CR=1 FL=1|tara:strand:- start:3138 stop:3899 length:762 start_codon:yes stop_codon:yes gene_type:complete
MAFKLKSGNKPSFEKMSGVSSFKDVSSGMVTPSESSHEYESPLGDSPMKKKWWKKLKKGVKKFAKKAVKSGLSGGIVGMAAGGIKSLLNKNKGGGEGEAQEAVEGATQGEGGSAEDNAAQEEARAKKMGFLGMGVAKKGMGFGGVLGNPEFFEKLKGMKSGDNLPPGAGADIFSKMGGFFSDCRLKENIEKIGLSKSGIPIYKFNYIGDDSKYSGAMAQDLLKMKPNVVRVDEESGYYKVDYNNIDVNMRLLN